MCRTAQLKGGDELVAVRDVEDDNGNGKKSGMVRTTSSGNIDLEEALLAL